MTTTGTASDQPTDGMTLAASDGPIEGVFDDPAAVEAESELLRAEKPRLCGAS